VAERLGWHRLERWGGANMGQDGRVALISLIKRLRIGFESLLPHQKRKPSMNTFSKIIICIGYIILFAFIVGVIYTFNQLPQSQKQDFILYQLMQQQ
jgi:hypothetical protein